MKKKYQAPVSEINSLESSFKVLDMSLAFYDRDPKTIENPDDYFITDGSQILSPKINLWDEEEEY